jgi:hypothetical protein
VRRFFELAIAVLLALIIGVSSGSQIFPKHDTSTMTSVVTSVQTVVQLSSITFTSIKTSVSASTDTESLTVTCTANTLYSANLLFVVNQTGDSPAPDIPVSLYSGPITYPVIYSNNSGIAQFAGLVPGTYDYNYSIALTNAGGYVVLNKGNFTIVCSDYITTIILPLGAIGYLAP